LLRYGDLRDRFVMLKHSKWLRENFLRCAVGSQGFIARRRSAGNDPPGRENRKF
jgi:hypothetical protein